MASHRGSSGTPAGYSETVEAEGHLIDSGDLQGILTTVVEHGAAYEIERFDAGRTNEDTSRLTLRVRADTPESLAGLLECFCTGWRLRWTISAGARRTG